MEGISNHNIQLDLSNPGMTFLHNAGMAGLWMTLKQLERMYPSPSQRVGNLTWLLTSRNISLGWEGQDFSILDWLLKKSFQISHEGLISFTGLNSSTMSLQTQIAMHQGITGTFLQHNQSLQSEGKESMLISVNDIELDVEYKKVVSYAHQHFARELSDEHGQLRKEPISIIGWLYPGAVVRHEALKAKTQFQEKPEHALVLLFAPIACQYFVLRSHLQPEHRQYVLVIPKVTDLQLYAERCWELRNLNYQDFHASSLGDCGLKFLTDQTTIEQAQHSCVRKCQVISFTKVAWAKQQNTRTAIAVIELSERIELNYKLICQYFPKYITLKLKNKKIITTSFVHGIISDNVAKGLPWWFSLSTKIKNYDFLHPIEKDGFYKMIQHSEWDIKAQMLFIQACHEALRKRYAKIYSKTKEGEYAQIERENTRIASDIKRCTNAENFRKFIAEFWGKAGHISILEEHWETLLPLTTGMIDWKVARDLTWIAIASYPKSNKSQTETLE